MSKQKLVASRMCFVCSELITHDKEPHNHDSVTPKSLAEQIEAIQQQMLVDYTAWVNGEPTAWNVKKADANAAILAAIQQTVMGVRPAFQNEHPSDPETGATVETYGYEATYNQALKDWTAALETELTVTNKDI